MKRISLSLLAFIAIVGMVFVISDQLKKNAFTAKTWQGVYTSHYEVSVAPTKSSGDSLKNREDIRQFLNTEFELMSDDDLAIPQLLGSAHRSARKVDLPEINDATREKYIKYFQAEFKRIQAEKAAK